MLELTRVASRSLEAVRSLPLSSTTNPDGGLGNGVGIGGSKEGLESVTITSLLLFFLLLFFAFLLLEERFLGGTVCDSEALQMIERSVGI